MKMKGLEREREGERVRCREGERVREGELEVEREREGRRERATRNMPELKVKAGKYVQYLKEA